MENKNLTPAVASTSVRRSLGPILLGCGALGWLAACSSEPLSHVVSAPPPAAPVTTMTTTTTTAPTVVTQQANGSTMTVPASTTTVVTQAPPAMQTEPVLAQPSLQHVWLPGYWTWRNERYEWMAGHWELPPANSSRWVAPRWEREGNAYRFHEGYWN